MKKFFIIAIIILLSSLASGASVGVSPGFIDVGEVSPGDSFSMDFYITTNLNENFILQPQYSSTTKFVGDSGIEMENVSEQNIEDWVEWSQNSYDINPTTSQSYRLPDGTPVNAEGKITLEVTIPSNPEPGYKVGEIDLNPSIGGEGAGAGARVFGQTVPGFAFKVPGSVNRDIDLAAVEAFRIRDNRAQLIFQLRNSGTVTTKFMGAQIDIRDEEGSRVGVVSTDSAILSPGESAEVDVIWSSESIEGGEYSLEGTGDYKTGETYISGDFVITDNIQQRQSVDEPSGSQTEGQESSAPIVMIVIISLLLATLLYMLDVGLTWIIMFSGGLAVALYVLLGPVSNALILIPVLSIILMLYI